MTTAELEKEKLLFSVNEAAAMMSVSSITIRRLVKTGKLAHRRVRDRVLFTRDDLSKFIESDDARKPSTANGYRYFALSNEIFDGEDFAGCETWF